MTALRRVEVGVLKTALIGAEPQVFVADIGAAFEFYTGRLGFAVAFSYGDPPFYGQVARGGARLNVRCVAGSVLDRERREQEMLLSATITVADADALFGEFVAAGVDFAQTIRTEAWGARGFVVRDLDGNLVLFAGSDGGA
jgi:uncharacterized glyoxalase superfamily protein PhnB